MGTVLGVTGGLLLFGLLALFGMIVCTILLILGMVKLIRMIIEAFRS